MASDCREGGERSEPSTSSFKFYIEISWRKLNIYLHISIECLLKLIGMENLLPSKRDLLGIYGRYVINSLSIYNILQGATDKLLPLQGANHIIKNELNNRIIK